VGSFPVLWAEWNGKYRDTVRKFWKGDGGQLSDLGYRLTGSSDLYQNDGRKPYASINFVTAHDGFTLEDLVSYSHKHNEANGEGNQDGANDNHSWNLGVEGPTQNSTILRRRERQKRNFLATLLLSQGVPMLLGGDEIGRTQRGNNNSYCQDNEVSWYDWNLDGRRKRFLEFARRLIELRKAHPNFRRRKFYQDSALYQTAEKDIAWYAADGREMGHGDWNAHWARSIAVLFNGQTLNITDDFGQPVTDDTFLVILNSYHQKVRYTLPASPNGRGWRLVLDTANAEDPFGARNVEKEFEVVARSFVVLKENGSRDI
jgi:glycogen operon protein